MKQHYVRPTIEVLGSVADLTHGNSVTSPSIDRVFTSVPGQPLPRNIYS